MKKLLLIALIFIGFNGFSQTFKSGAILGVSAAQVEGDGYGGYKKPGLILGAFTNTDFSDHVSMQFEIYYIGKGARKIPDPAKGDFRSFNLRLNYLEVPLVVRYRHKSFFFELGGYYGYLLNVKMEDQFGEVNIQQNPYPFKSADIGGVLGLEYHVNDNFIINFRTKNSLVPIRDFNNLDQNIGFLNKLFNRGWYNVDLNFSIRYQLIGKN